MDSYHLVSQGDLALTDASTIWVEAAATGKCVIVASNNDYSDALFFHVPAYTEDYNELIGNPNLSCLEDVAVLAQRFL